MRRHAIKYTPRSLWHSSGLSHCCGPCSCCDHPCLLWLTARSHHSDNQKEDEVTGTSTCVCVRVRMPKNEHSRLCFRLSSCVRIFKHTRSRAGGSLGVSVGKLHRKTPEKVTDVWFCSGNSPWAWERGRERTSAVLLRAMSRALIASMEMNTAVWTEYVSAN